MNNQSNRITDRLPDANSEPHQDHGRITDVLSAVGTDQHSGVGFTGLKIGELVADRYLVEEGPMGGPSGEAAIFRCRDRQTDMRVALKFYKTHVAPKQSVLELLVNLHHPHIVALKDYGTWTDHFFEVMEYCEGGKLSDFMPIGEDDLKNYLTDIIIALKYCHDQGIIHRDIKPTNVFFRQANKQGIVIGDFGISSILAEEETAHITKTGAFLTYDYAAPELLDRNEVSSKTDYYALGITMIHLATGHSPFRGMNDMAIAFKHFRGDIPIPAGLSPDFQRLLKGLLRTDPQRRWGYDQIMAWHNGAPILTEDRAPDREDIYAGKSFPYPGYQKVTTPLELAGHLADFNAERDLFRGRISQWVHLFDADLSNRIVEIEENYTDNQTLGLFKLRYLLNPTQPLMIRGNAICNIPQLVTLLQSTDEAVQSALKEAFWNQQIECWLEAAIDDPRTPKLISRMKAIRERLKGKPNLGPFALLYTLDPSAPLSLAPGVQISRLESLEDALAARSDLVRIISQYLYGGQFEEWLSAAFPDSTADHTFIFHCRNTYTNDEELGVYAFRWYFSPQLPFPFGHKKVNTPKELAAIIDSSDQSQKQGMDLLRKGWIRTWLTTTVQMKDAAPFDKIINETGVSWERKMETVLHLLDPDLPWPKVSADQREVRLDRIDMESSQAVTLRFSNSGRGYLSGAFSLAGKSEGVSIDQLTMEGGPQVVTIRIDARGLVIGSRYKTTLVAETNGGRLEVPISLRVVAPVAVMIARSLGVGLLAGLVMGIFRLIVGTSVAANGMLDFVGFDTLDKQGGRYFVMIIWAVALVGGIGGGLTYLFKMSKIKGSRNC